MGATEVSTRRASTLRRLAVLAGVAMMMSAASGQTVHRCVVNGKVSYSNEPCVVTIPGATKNQQPAAPAFRCDGRLHCSQMTSCGEAKLFLKHCPGVKMDGDRDGVPCEQQWCTGPGSR